MCSTSARVRPRHAAGARGSFHLACDESAKRRAISCLKYVAGVAGKGSVQDLLEDNFPLILESLNKHIVQVGKGGRMYAAPDVDAMHALRSLNGLVQLMKHRLVPFLPTVISALKVSLGRPALRPAALGVWRSLVQTLPSERGLAPYLATIAGNLLPYLNVCGEEVVWILEHLIVTKGEALRAHFHELPFLPREDPQLAKIIGVIDDELGWQTGLAKTELLTKPKNV